MVLLVHEKVYTVQSKNPMACDTAVFEGRYLVNRCDRELAFALAAQSGRAETGGKTLFMAAMNQCSTPIMNITQNSSFNVGSFRVFFCSLFLQSC